VSSVDRRTPRRVARPPSHAAAAATPARTMFASRASSPSPSPSPSLARASPRARRARAAPATSRRATVVLRSSLVPIRPRSRGERRSLRTFPASSSSSSSSASAASPREKKIVGVGSAGVDYLASIASFPKPDAKLRTDAFETQGGGNAGNALVAMARLGAEARSIYLTLVPVRPRSRGERRSLRTFVISRRVSPPRVPRFQSPPSAPFNATPDAFEPHPGGREGVHLDQALRRRRRRRDPRRVPTRGRRVRERRRRAREELAVHVHHRRPRGEHAHVHSHPGAGVSRGGDAGRRRRGASHLALVPIRPRRRGERDSLRTLLPGWRAFLSAHHPSLVSIPTRIDAFQLHPRRLSTPPRLTFARAETHRRRRPRLLRRAAHRGCDSSRARGERGRRARARRRRAAARRPGDAVDARRLRVHEHGYVFVSHWSPYDRVRAVNAVS